MALPSASVRPIQPAAADDEEEAPLDPAVERIRQRLKRLLLVSVATLMIGLVAVVAAVLYKVGPVRDKPALGASGSEAVLDGAMPPGAHLLSSALDGRLLALTFDDGGTTRVVVIDLDANKVLRRLVLRTGSPPASP